MKSKHLAIIADADDRTWLGWWRIKKAYGVFRREQRAWTNAMLKAAVRGALPPLAGNGDFVLTPGGLGQVVERICDAKGNIAPSLAALLEMGPLPPGQMDALNGFVQALYDWHIPAYDLGPKNIVWQEQEARFVLVDGFGDRAVVPLVTWFRALNDLSLDRAFAEMAQKSGLDWDKTRRRLVQKGPA